MSGDELCQESIFESMDNVEPIPINDEIETIIDESRKNNFLTLKDKAEILQRLDEGELASSLAREYGISQSTISRFKKRKESIQKAVTTIYSNNSNRRTLRGTFYKKTEEALYQWYLEERQKNIDVTGTMLRNKAQYFYNKFKESNYSFCASVGWLTRFKKRYGIQFLNNSQTFAREELNEKPNTSKQAENQSNSNDGQTQTNVAVQSVDKKDAIRCIDTVIKWSSENEVDSLYITMLRNLKNQMKLGKQFRLICK